MLAHNGLALITEKLQNQRLEESSSPPAGVASLGPGLSSQCSVLTPGVSPAANTNYTSVVNRLPQVGCDNVVRSTGQHQSNLAVKGKNVWALTVESERSSVAGRQDLHPFRSAPTPRPPTLRPRPLHVLQVTDKGTPISSHGVPVSYCRHKKLRQSNSCQLCESAPGTPTAPPKKKHCRSLSVPPDNSASLTSTSILLNSSGSARLWKPIDVTLRHGNTRADRSSEACSTNAHNPFSSNKERISSPGAVFGLTDTPPPLPPEHWLPNLSISSNTKFAPPSASTTSSDSGHFTTSTSDFQTPPGSPEPLHGVMEVVNSTNPFSVAAFNRPASALSMSSHSSTWLDWSGVGGLSTHRATLVDGATSSGVRALQNRSLSCEDRISGSSSSFTTSSIFSGGGPGSTSCGPSSSCSHRGTAASMPCVHAAGTMESLGDPGSATSMLSSRCRSCSQDSGSLQLVDGSIAGRCSGTNIPRCHSQPCVLHHRRCGKKRRRNCDRPTLNFNKMTETAYTLGSRRSEPWSTPAFIQPPTLHGHQQRCKSSPLTFASVDNPSVSSRLSFVLNPIASSPLDTDIPSDLATVTLNSRDPDLHHAASVALPLTPPDQGSFPSPPPMVSVGPPHLRGLDRISGRFGRGSNNNEGDDTDGREEDDDDEIDEEEDSRNCGCRDSRADEGVGLVFPMIDLDLEQIENH